MCANSAPVPRGTRPARFPAMSRSDEHPFTTTARTQFRRSRSRSISHSETRFVAPLAPDSTTATTHRSSAASAPEDEAKPLSRSDDVRNLRTPQRSASGADPEPRATEVRDHDRRARFPPDPIPASGRRAGRRPDAGSDTAERGDAPPVVQSFPTREDRVRGFRRCGRAARGVVFPGRATRPLAGKQADPSPRVGRRREPRRRAGSVDVHPPDRSSESARRTVSAGCRKSFAWSGPHIRPPLARNHRPVRRESVAGMPKTRSGHEFGRVGRGGTICRSRAIGGGRDGRRGGSAPIPAVVVEDERSPEVSRLTASANRSARQSSGDGVAHADNLVRTGDGTAETARSSGRAPALRPIGTTRSPVLLLRPAHPDVPDACTSLRLLPARNGDARRKVPTPFISVSGQSPTGRERAR